MLRIFRSQNFAAATCGSRTWRLKLKNWIAADSPRDDVRSVILGCVLAGAIGTTTTAYGATKKLSGTDACGMAKAELLNRQGGQDKREVNVLNCAQFSVFDLGMASIHVLYDTSYFNEYMKTRYETKNLTDVCHFMQTGREWKLVRCK